MSWLSEECKQFWTWSSTWLNAAIIAAPVLYVQFQVLQAYLPEKFFFYGMSALGVLNLINTVRKKQAEPPLP